MSAIIHGRKSAINLIDDGDQVKQGPSVNDAKMTASLT
jgi:hypothetical protein